MICNEEDLSAPHANRKVIRDEDEDNSVDKLRHAVAVAFFFFSATVSARSLLPGALFKYIRLRKAVVRSMHEPPRRFAGALHKALHVWLMVEIATALKSADEVTATLAVSHGSTVLEAFQLHARKYPKVLKEFSEEEFE